MTDSARLVRRFRLLIAAYTLALNLIFGLLIAQMIRPASDPAPDTNPVAAAPTGTAIPITATPTRTPTPTITLTPTYATLEMLCADLQAAWDRDWPRVIGALQTISQRGQRCDSRDPQEMLYPAYYNYGAWLERRGRRPEAIAAYQKALERSPQGAQGNEAALALRRLNALTPPPPTTCPETQAVAAHRAIPDYVPQRTGSFVWLADGRFQTENGPFLVRGVNYYPSRAPWRRFLTDADLEMVAAELDLVAGAGFNTIRIFLWHEALFDCPGNGAVPKAEGFARLDGVLRLAAERDLRVLVTLNDLPDLVIRPLYQYPEAAAAQTAYIVTRYRDEATILAWDVRNEGDIDYIRGYARSRDVLNWLREITALVRQTDPSHLITAGWNENSYLTDSAVDFLSFHHWRTADNLSQRIADLRQRSQKPILLEEIGYPARAIYPDSVAAQAEKFRAALSVAESQGLLGWLAWTAFDFTPDSTCIPPACPSADNSEHHFGLWTTEYAPKPVIAVIREQFTGK